MTEEKTPLPQNFELCRRKRINLCSFRSKWIGWYKIYRKKWHTAWIRLHISLASAGISVCVCASVRHDTSVEFYIYRWRLAAELNVYTLCPFFTLSLSPRWIQPSQLSLCWSLKMSFQPLGVSFEPMVFAASRTRINLWAYCVTIKISCLIVLLGWLLYTHTISIYHFISYVFWTHIILLYLLCHNTCKYITMSFQCGEHLIHTMVHKLC